MNKEELEFERINRKLDVIFNLVNGLVAEQKREQYDRQLKELEDKAVCAEKEVNWHIGNSRYIEESNEWARKEWNDIDNHYYCMKNNEECNWRFEIKEKPEE